MDAWRAKQSKKKPPKKRAVDAQREKSRVKAWSKKCEAKNDDLICIFPGPKPKTQDAMGKFRNYIGDRTGLRKEGFSAHWVVDFPLLEWDEEEQRYNAMHHPFTSPKPEDIHLTEKDEAGNFCKEKIGRIRSN